MRDIDAGVMIGIGVSLAGCLTFATSCWLLGITPSLWMFSGSLMVGLGLYAWRFSR